MYTGYWMIDITNDPKVGKRHEEKKGSIPPTMVEIRKVVLLVPRAFPQNREKVGKTCVFLCFVVFFCVYLGFGRECVCLWCKAKETLQKHRKSWNHLSEDIAMAAPSGAPLSSNDAVSQVGGQQGGNHNELENCVVSWKKCNNRVGPKLGKLIDRVGPQSGEMCSWTYGCDSTLFNVNLVELMVAVMLGYGIVYHVTLWVSDVFMWCCVLIVFCLFAIVILSCLVKFSWGWWCLAAGWWCAQGQWQGVRLFLDDVQCWEEQWERWWAAWLYIQWNPANLYSLPCMSSSNDVFDKVKWNVLDLSWLEWRPCCVNLMSGM